MKAWTVKEAGGSDQLVLVDRPIPSVQEGDALVKVKAFGINRLEMMRREKMEKKRAFIRS